MAAQVEAVLYVPVTDTNSQPFTAADWALLHEQLAALAGGVTRRGPDQGIWTDPATLRSTSRSTEFMRISRRAWLACPVSLDNSRRAAMRTYTEMNGQVLELSGLSRAESAYFEQALTAFRARVPWSDFCKITQAAENPALEAGRVTNRSIESPLFLAILDMECRLGVEQGFLRPSPGASDSDPLADEEISIADAAKATGVSRQTLYTAVESGELIGTRERPARISRNSLSRWQPRRTRQRAS